MPEQLNLFPEPQTNFKVIHYFGGMQDTNGDEIYFVKTIKNGFTKILAEDYCRVMNDKLRPGSNCYFEAVDSSNNLI